MKNNFVYFKSNQTLSDAIRGGQFAQTIEQAENELESMYDGGYKSIQEYREQGTFIVNVDELQISDTGWNEKGN